MENQNMNIPSGNTAQSPSASSIDYDIVIVGAGAVGLTLACALEKAPLKIAVVSDVLDSKRLDFGQGAASESNRSVCVIHEDCEPSGNTAQHSSAKSMPDQRVSAITRASQHIFESLGVWPTIAKQFSPYRRMHVWEGGGATSIEFDSAELGEANLGYIIGNNVIQTALLEKLHTCKNITWMAPVKVSGVEWGLEKQTLQISDGQMLSCRLVIGADGAHSKIRDYANVTMSQSAYGHDALVTTIHTELPHQKTARQIFLPQGPLAFLPLADPHQCSIVWSSEPEHIKQLLEISPDEFKHKLAEAFEYRLGKITEIDKRLSFPLYMRHVSHYVKHGVALVGDAAHTLHPLAGQGMNLGLLDSACLAEVLLDAVQKKRDIAALSTLRRYERWRKGENATMIAAMQGFKTLFGSQQPVVQQLRRWGVTLTDSLPFIKHIFMRRAMGLTGDLPKIALPI